MKCDECDFKVRGNTEINKHKMSMHEGKMIKCDQCEKSFRYQEENKILQDIFRSIMKISDLSALFVATPVKAIIL